MVAPSCRQKRQRREGKWRLSGLNKAVGGHSLGAEAHAETGQVAVGEGEEDHEEDVPGVMGEEDGEVITRLNVAQHEEGDEDEPRRHQDRKPDAIFAWLWRKTTNFKTGANGILQCVEKLAAVDFLLRSSVLPLDDRILPKPNVWSSLASSQLLLTL